MEGNVQTVRFNSPKGLKEHLSNKSVTNMRREGIWDVINSPRSPARKQQGLGLQTQPQTHPSELCGLQNRLVSHSRILTALCGLHNMSAKQQLCLILGGDHLQLHILVARFHRPS